jgi:membrane protein YdbS with pleckstrin-like domain
MLIRENVLEGRKLDPKIKIRWFLERAMVVLPLFAAMAVLLYLLDYTNRELNPLYVTSAVLLIALLLAAAYGEVELRYRKFVYAFREKDFLIQKGVIEKIRYVIPYDKIQNVTVSRDFIEVALGLGTVHIETAAHVYLENDIVLAGISNDDNIVSELVARSKSARAESDIPKGAGERMLAVMGEVLEELREIKAALKAEPEKAEMQPITHRQAKSAAISDQLKSSKVLYDKTVRRRKEG